MRVVLKTLKASSFLMISLVLLFTLFMVRDLTRKEEAETTQTLTKGRESSNTITTTNIHRKLLQSSDEKYGIKRLGTDCSKEDIEIHQEQVSPRPNGIPVYLVKITNIGVSGSSISNIHLRCGSFSSATLVNPKVFKRLNFDDCFVNDGQPISPGTTISFYYSNTYLYPLSVSSVVCDNP